MTLLIKKLEANKISDISKSITLIKSMDASLQREDYINLNSFIGYLQNLSKVEVTTGLLKPSPFGLKNIRNIEMITLNINY